MNAIQRAKSEAFGLAKDVAIDALTGKNIAKSLKTRGIQRVKTRQKFDSRYTNTQRLHANVL